MEFIAHHIIIISSPSEHIYIAPSGVQKERIQVRLFFFMSHMHHTSVVGLYKEITPRNYNSTPVCSLRTCLCVTLMRRTSVVHLHRRS